MASITLYQFARGLGLPNPSPFCMKMEGILKLANLDYEVKVQNDPRSAPMGKLPYIKHQSSNQQVADSHLVTMELVESLGVNLDKNLSAEDAAIQHALRVMLEERLYFVLLYSRWAEDESWEQLRDILFAPIPKLIRKLIANRIRDGVVADLKSQGMGRHTRENIYRLGCEDIKALSVYLGDKTWFGGDSPNVLDATAVSFLANFLVSEIGTPVKTEIERCSNLLNYVKRSLPEIYGDEYQV